MRLSDLGPQVHFFVCANRRDANSTLGPGCGDAGDALYDALKKEVAHHREHARVWVTKTACMGICPSRGATCARYPHARIFTEVEASEAALLYAARDEKTP
ncbi:MAG: hypothetical protein ACRELY_23780 [Polyangiaceae bacterium]